MNPDKVQREELKVQIRWLIRRDMPEVLGIEEACFSAAWSENDFLTCLRQRNCIGMVAEYNHEIVGFMIYELHKSRLRIMNFAVAPGFQRQRVGSQMVQRLIDKLSQQRRQEIQLEVRETNLTAQKFFAAQGFKAVSVLREFYEDTDEDAYMMKYHLYAEDEMIYSFVPRNRIAEFDVSEDSDLDSESDYRDAA